MRFVFGYAGIPFEVYDGIYNKRNWICGDSGEFISTPMRGGAGDAEYRQSDGNFFLSSFYKLIASDHHDGLRDTGFAVIYVNHPSPSTTVFARRFFPSILCILVDWTLDKTSGASVRRSKNQLLNQLKVATEHAKKGIPPIKKEVTERDNRTPLLLPIKNFKSNCLVAELEVLQTDLLHVSDKQQVIGRVIRNIENEHPRQRDDTERYGHSYFVDHRNIMFRPPGKDRHAFARPQSGHPETCLLSGRRRLGAPYDRAFHYDCTRGTGALKDLFFGCHEDPSVHEGTPHLNIAPNDFVRP